MKHLQLTPPLLIITMGYPGAGKTFFARQFAELYGLARVSEDRIRYELFEEPLFNKDESEIISRVSESMLEEIMKTERTIVYEGSFLTLKERKRVYQLANKAEYRTLTVWLQTDVETSAQRAMNRDRRNIDSKYSFSIDKATFESLKNQLERPQENETAVVISGKHAFKSQCLTVLRKIASLYGNNAGVPTRPQVVRTIPGIQPRNGQRIIQ